MKIKSFFSSSLQKISEKNNANEPPLNGKYSKTAVLLIDMQSDFLKKIPSKKANQIIRNQIKIIQLCVKMDIPLFVLEYKWHGKTILELHKEISKIRKKEIITKKHDNGFFKTSLAEKIKKLGVNQVVLMGINASACVRSTGIGALNNGLKIITSERLIADPTPYGYSWFKENGTHKRKIGHLIQAINA